jgi:lipopolysaccharide export system protein LptA
LAEGGLRLTSDKLRVTRFPDTVHTPEEVQFDKPGLEGTSGAMRYVIQHGELDLMDGVDMTFRRDGSAPVRVTSASAILRRKQDFVRFLDDVRVRQRTKTMTANELRLYLTEDDSKVEHMEAYENVDLRWDVLPESEPSESDESVSAKTMTEIESGKRTASDSAVTKSISVAQGPGRKRLVTDNLEVLMREDGQTLSRVRALDGGTLYLYEPENRTTGYDKKLEGNLLAFDFDDEGRLSTLRGRGGVEIALTPVGARATEPQPQPHPQPHPDPDPDSEPEYVSGQRTVVARQLEADFDVDTGDLIEARCSRTVEFQQEGSRASADHGVFVAESSRLILTESPRIWDDNVRLEAQVIRIDTVSGDVDAEGEVRSASQTGAGAEDGPGSATGLFPGASEGPVYFVADRLAYDREQDVAIYTGAARGFQGPNRVEAEEIRVLQTRGELVAKRDVRTVFVQDGAKEEPVGRAAAGGDSRRRQGEGQTRADRASRAFTTAITRANEMTYRRDTHRIEYRGDAETRSGDMSVRGDGIDVVLGEGNGGLVEVVAFGEVEVHTSEGDAAGELAKYLPNNESFTVSGPSASFESDGKVTEAKQLTFFLGDDRIFVDGREESRTTTKYSPRPRPRPF